MLNIAFQYDVYSKEWVVCKDEVCLYEDIEKIPCAVLIPHASKSMIYVTVQPVGQKSFVKELENGEKADIKHVLTAAAEEKDYLYKPPYIEVNGEYAFRWRIFQSTAGGAINIACDIASVIIRQNGDFLKKWCTWKTVSCVANQKKDIILFKNLDTAYSKDLHDIKRMDQQPKIRIPDIVAGTAIEAMRDGTGVLEGIRPSVLSCTSGWEKILAYFEHPFDVNIYYLKNFIGDAFDELFPRNCRDNFRPLCDYLEIRKPPKSLRKAHTFYPYAVVWFCIFRQWGIHDINLIQRFKKIKKWNKNRSLESFHYFPKEKYVGLFNYYAKENWKRFEYFCKWLIERIGEKRFMHWFYQAIKEDSLGQIANDCLRMFYGHADDISEELRELIARDKLSNRVHNALCSETAFLKRQKYERILYEDAMAKLECNLNDYEFRLTHSTQTIVQLGMIFSNCVAGYCDDAINKRCAIAYVRQGDRYVACIELINRHGKLHIKQALGKYNEYLDETDRFFCRYWANLFKMTYEEKYLGAKERDIIIPDVKYERISHQKGIDEMYLKELQEIPKKKIVRGYYEILWKELKNVTKKRLNEPPWMHFTDEYARLMYLYPEAQRIYEAAFDGNMEAAYVLGQIYMDDIGVPHDYSLAKKWMKIAKSAGHPNAWRVLKSIPLIKYMTNDEMDEYERRIAKAILWLRQKSIIEDKNQRLNLLDNAG